MTIGINENDEPLSYKCYYVVQTAEGALTCRGHTNNCRKTQDVTVGRRNSAQMPPDLRSRKIRPALVGLSLQTDLTKIKAIFL